MAFYHPHHNTSINSAAQAANRSFIILASQSKDIYKNHLVRTPHLQGENCHAGEYHK
ncbi:hypothetical protein BCIN_06g05060 [Botrytis cinerea B05.10]|uniref:Uncharacterized protein n=1 Tax=Botryotinia fuckeliana (strain B05.10) TaxID=332648 RepID=A0A384JKP8_BOTFB|nr:hypothetical protein BCIN_06g05060 [Botrytis cinerea B05.10]ATZ51062.1 hypothetical protein BCIN_06g05060 [Botrytis cinerea B05.10]